MTNTSCGHKPNILELQESFLATSAVIGRCWQSCTDQQERQCLSRLFSLACIRCPLLM